MWIVNRERDTSGRAALLAVVFALGGGEAAAQLTPDDTLDGNGLKVRWRRGWPRVRAPR